MAIFSFDEVMKKHGVTSKDVTTVTPPTTQPVQSPMQDRLADVGNQTFDTISQNLAGTGDFAGQSPLRRGVQATAAAFSSVPRGALAAIPDAIGGNAVRQGVEVAGDAIGKGFSALTGLIGSNPELQKWVMENPEAAKKIEEGAGVLAAGGEIAGSMLGARGVTQTLTKGTALTNKAASTGLQAIKEVTSEMKGVTSIKDAVTKGFQPEDLMQRVARTSKGKQAKFQELSGGESVGQYLVSRDIFGTPDVIVDKLTDRMRTSMKTVDTGLAKITKPVSTKVPAIDEALKALVENEAKTTVAGVASRDGKIIADLVQKASTGKLTITDVNLLKRVYERNVKVSYNKLNNADGVAKATNIDTALRNLVESEASKSGFDGVGKLNKETQLARQLMDDIGAEYAGQAGNNAIGLSDMILLAEATGNPTAAAAFFAKRIGSSKSVMSSVAQRMATNPATEKMLPTSNISKPQPLTGYLKFLEDQKK